MKEKVLPQSLGKIKTSKNGTEWRCYKDKRDRGPRQKGGLSGRSNMFTLKQYATDVNISQNFWIAF